MTLTHSLTLPAACRHSYRGKLESLSSNMDFLEYGNDEYVVMIDSTVLSNIEKVSKVFNYMARIFSSASAMLNNFITIYNTVKQLNEFISNNF